MATATNQPGFFDLVPRRATLLFFMAVFFIFAPVALLPISLSDPTPGTGWIALVWVLSGGVAVSWAATFTLSRWGIAGIVFFQLGMFLVFGLAEVRGRVSWEGVATTAAIVAGYVLFVVFITGQGRTTLRLKTEMDLARQIHATLAPPISTRNDHFEVHGVSIASSEMGGDLIDVVEHARGTDIFVADVSGHGVRAGVVMGMVKSAFRALVQSPRPLSETLTGLNALLEQVTTSDMYATFAGFRVPREGGDLEFAVAGHSAVLHYRQGVKEPATLGSRHLPLGMFSQSCETETAGVEPGDLLAAYTDGLNETEDASGEQLGHAAIEATIGELRDQPLERIAEAVLQLTQAHGTQDDDRSLLLVRVR
jgi:hypothetical protein